MHAPARPASHSRRPRPLALLTALAAVALAAWSCAHDTILPVADSHCGDGNLDPGEQCDVQSDGCQQCQIVSGWQCDDSGCATVCGDGQVAGAEECDPPDGKTCDRSCWKGTQPAACDMTGYWIARQTNFSDANAFPGAIQTSTNWYAYRMEQSGADVTVKASLFCGIQVSGSVNVLLSEASTRALMYRNPQHKQDPDLGGNVRTGTFAPNSAGGCDFFMAAHWYVRGAAATLLPAHPWATQLDPTPAANSFGIVPPIPSQADESNAVDIEGSGHKGAAYDVTGLLSGTRYVVQRDWEWRRSDADHPISQNAIELVAGDVFSNQENILEVACSGVNESCPGNKCGLLCQGSTADLKLEHRITMRWLGTSLDDARVKHVFTKEPGADEAADLAACAAVRAALPHDPSKK